jgi:hypothetical protein
MFDRRRRVVCLGAKLCGCTQVGTYLMRMAGLFRVDMVARMGNHHPSQPAGRVARMLMFASFPLRVIFQARQAPQGGSAAAVHHYGPRTKPRR